MVTVDGGQNPLPQLGAISEPIAITLPVDARRESL